MTALPLRTAPSPWRLWALWMLATLAAGIAFLLLGFPLNQLFLFFNYGPPGGTGPIFDPNVRALIVLPVYGLLGAVLGFAQWLVLRRYLRGTGWWVLATAIGYSIPFSGVLPRLWPGAGPLGGLLLMPVSGLLIGLAQWLVLRARLGEAYWWIVVTPIAWALGYGLSGLFAILQLYIEPMDLLFVFFIPPALQGALFAVLLDRVPELWHEGSD